MLHSPKLDKIRFQMNTTNYSVVSSVLSHENLSSAFFLVFQNVEQATHATVCCKRGTKGCSESK